MPSRCDEPLTVTGVRARRRATRIALLLPLIAAATWFALLGGTCGPWGRTPGFALLGERAAGPVSNWEFVRGYPEIGLETRTPWLVPHSVTVAWLLVDGELFIPSRDAASKTWVGQVLRQPQVRLRIGERIYEGRLAREQDLARRERLSKLAFEKWPRFRSRGEDRAAIWFFRVDPL